MKIGDIITVEDSIIPDTLVPALVTAVAENGSVSVYVFGSSDVIEKRTGIEIEAAKPPETVTATDTPTSTKSEGK